MRNRPYGSQLRSARYERFEDRLALSAQAVAGLLASHGMEPPTPDFYLTSELEQRIETHLEQLEQHIQEFNELGNRGTGELNQHVGELDQLLSDVHDASGVNYVHNTYGFTGAGQTVAVIDSGIAWDHLALGAGLGENNRVVGGWDFAEGDADPYDDGPAGFHGTHVAGIIGSSNSTYRGVASDVDLVGLRVFDDNGAGYFSWVEQALQWVHDHRNDYDNPITTVNLSLGTDWNSDTVPGWSMIEDELAQLEQDGIFIAVSAGNSFQSYNEPGLSYPASSPYVVPVASVDNDGALSYFSQRHSRVIAAPGRSITSTVPDYVFGADGDPNDFGTASGTSMASPYVAGAATLVRQAMEFVGLENITQDTIYDHIRSTADIFYDPDTNANYHRLNLQSALDALMPDDDYGSTVQTAHSIGTVNGQTSLTGLIGTLDDKDYFTFTAGATGTATVNLDASTLKYSLSGGSTRTAGETLTLDVQAGETYTLAVQADARLESYVLNVNLSSSAPVINAEAVLDATTWKGSQQLADTGRYGGFFGDDLVAVDLNKSYQLSGLARAGNGDGSGFQANNRQYFGFASYDVDGNLILPHHVQKFTGAADTRLAQALRPGDTQIVLQDASGWNNGGAAHQRSFAWYGYFDSSGQVYEDYTYTRNVKYKDAWDVGAIDYETNTIALRTPWDGPEVEAGIAVRNAQSGATYNYAALSGSVPNDWTQYEATISGVSSTNARSFRPGTAYIKSLLLTNYHGQVGNEIAWKDIKLSAAEGLTAGDRVDLVVQPLDASDASYSWTQLSGPSVEIVNANAATATITSPGTLLDYQLSFEVTVSSDGVSTSDTITLDVAGNHSLLDAEAILDATTWNGDEELGSSSRYGAFFGDDLVAVDGNKTYQLSGWARSGNEDGSAYQGNNRQYFGFASYDVDGNLILPHHVQKVAAATDTRLAQALRPGDTQIVLEDASGWSNGGSAHQRSLAWFGYSDSNGRVYEDYTYTRNVKYMNVWDAGGIDYGSNTITLRTPWDGPELGAGEAIRNARSGATYNYAALTGGHVPNEWTQYDATIGGVSSTASTSFRPGTAYIKSLLLTNYHGQDGNTVTWKNVELSSTESFAAGDQVDLSVQNLELDNAEYSWTQLSGPAIEIVNANRAGASFTAPERLLDSSLEFQVTVSGDGVSISDSVTVKIAGAGSSWDAEAVLDATTWNGAEDFQRTSMYGAEFGDDLVAIDANKSYQLSGWARSGNENGGQYHANNRQYFGFASYDVDSNLILPHHVSKFAGAADTRLAQALRPGDTQVVLEDASGWNNGGSAHQRSLSWYGYSDSTGHVYEDYTYTQNVKYKDAWDAGAINYDTNTITLKTAWTGPEVEAGVAVRNAQSGATFNYAALNGTVANEWTQYQATIGGTSATSATGFRPGTASIKPLVLTNYHGQDGNLIAWKDIQIRPAASFAAGDDVELSVRSGGMSNVTYAWSQVSGPEVQIVNGNSAIAGFRAPESPGDYQLSFQVTISDGELSANNTLPVNIAGSNVVSTSSIVELTTLTDSPDVDFALPATAGSGDLLFGRAFLFGSHGQTANALTATTPSGAAWDAEREEVSSLSKTRHEATWERHELDKSFEDTGTDLEQDVLAMEGARDIDQNLELLAVDRLFARFEPLFFRGRGNA